MKNADLLSRLLWEERPSYSISTAFSIAGQVADLQSYYWSKYRGSYVDETTGRSVPESRVRFAVDRTNSRYVADNIANITDKFIEGKIDLPTWQEQMAKEIKRGHLANLATGKGGRASVNFSDWGKAGSRLKFQYQKLNDFAQAIKMEAVTDAQLRFRANMYANSVRTSYFDGLTRAKVAAGFKEERRVTTSEVPCLQCEQWADRGWQPIGTVPEPGIECDGFTSCKCYKQYR